MGKIRLYRVSTGYRARTLFRDFDGHTREIERTASGKGAATRALKEAVRDRVHLDGNAEITPDTRVKDLTHAWVTSLDAQSTTKSTAGMRALALPTWCVEVLQHRAQHLAASDAAHGTDPVFPAPKGGLRDPSNTQGDLRETLAWCGLPGITSHIFRKTTATLLDNAGLSARRIADQP